MTNEISKAIKIGLKTLGWYQIIGGIMGLLLTIYLLAKTGGITGVAMLLYLAAIGLYVFSIYSGRLLLGKRYETGLSFTIVNQLLQIFNFLVLGYGYFYISGAFLMGAISVNHTDGFKMGLDFGLTSKWRLDWNSDDTSFELGVNFLAVYLSYFAYNLRKKISQRNIDDIISNDLAIYSQ